MNCMEVFCLLLLVCSAAVGQSIKGGAYKGGSYDVLPASPLFAKMEQHSQPMTSCLLPQFPKGGTMQCNDANTECTATCDHGGEFEPGVTAFTLTCDAVNGRWLPRARFPDCYDTQPTCPALEAPKGAVVTCTGDNRVCVATCKEGKVLPGGGESMTLTCDTALGQWRPFGGFPDCRELAPVSQVPLEPPTGPPCEMPPSPKAASTRCKILGSTMECTATCMRGFRFPEGVDAVTLTCDAASRVWGPTPVFPDCEGVCEPACLNGGQCYGDNRCVCARGFRGNYCQYSVKLCDPRKFAFGGGFKCQHSPLVTTCNVSCPSGFQFETPSPGVYKCTPEGDWDTTSIPKCVPGGETGGETGGQVVGPSCQMPPAPKAASTRCRTTAGVMECTATCMKGFSFPQGLNEVTLTCDASTGVWGPTPAFPDCEGVCEPACLNGGQCYGDNRCVCAKGFRGDYCQYAVSLCDLRKFNFNGGFKCRHAPTESVCNVSCPEGLHFEAPSPGVYLCSPEGVWNAESIPNCVPEVTAPPCEAPPRPKDASMRCRTEAGKMHCTATCTEGLRFPLGLNEITLTCDAASRVWGPTPVFPDCRGVCEPACLNGGECDENSRCVCARGFRGEYCQYSVSLCDPRKFQFGGAFQCQHSAAGTVCHMSCYEGFHFETPPLDAYQCSAEGVWNSESVPACVPDGPPCEAPPSPKGASTRCKTDGGRMECTATCAEGFRFPQGLNEVTLTCDAASHVWGPTPVFPDCEGVCEPGCLNGGECYGNNRCVCPKDFRGDRCEYPTTLCDPKNFEFGGAFHCQHSPLETVCNVSCPQGFHFETPSPAVYQCTFEGVWSPPRIPKCVPDSGGGGFETGDQIKEPDTTEEPFPSGKNPCQIPPSPKSASTNCKTVDGKMECTARCAKGFRFANGEGALTLTCDAASRTWGPVPAFPDCEGVCDPKCLNGGRCFGDNRCVCTQKFRGDHCQHHVSLCDSPNMEFGGSLACKHSHFETTCNVSCPEGTRFETPAPDVYRCSLEGVWNPPRIPKCIKDEGEQGDEGHKGDLVPPTISPVPSDLIPASGVCSLWGKFHMKTFDGTIYRYPSACSYTLVKDCGEGSTYSVKALYGSGCPSSPNCTRTVEVVVAGRTLHLPLGKALPTDLAPAVRNIPGVTMQPAGKYTVFKSNIGITIWVDSESVQIKLSEALQSSACGMCGNFDGDATNDLTALGRKVNLRNFAAHWMQERDCIDKDFVEDACSLRNGVDEEASSSAFDRCSIIFHDLYEKCHQVVPPKRFFNACKQDCCDQGSVQECQCASIDEYFRECQRMGVSLERTWRKRSVCPHRCENGTEYQECGPACRPTCANREPACPLKECAAGCHCPQGKLWQNNHCVAPEHCNCVYRGREYNVGEEVTQDCNTCVCMDGTWACSTEICDATCAVLPMGAYHTFDGHTFHADETCTFVLVSTDEYEVLQDRSNCYADGSTCVGDIFVRIRNGAIEVKVNQELQVLVNKREVTNLPAVVNIAHISKPIQAAVEITLPGLTIITDGRTRVELVATALLFTRTMGLCGTFNHNSYDDYTTETGEVDQEVSSFTQSWNRGICGRIKPQALECVQEGSEWEGKKRTCDALYRHPFTECHDDVNPDIYHKLCMEVACSCSTVSEQCLCPTLAHYAFLCSQRGRLVNWRPEVHQCPVRCGEGLTYQTCPPRCLTSCDSISKNVSCTERCLEGCACPVGFTLNKFGRCVSPEECGCLRNGREYPAGSKEKIGREDCECRAGKWYCTQPTGDLVVTTTPPPTCQANEEYTDCIHTCPLTCDNYGRPDTGDTCEVGMCKSGCTCKKGFVRDDVSGKCISPQLCPCSYGGKTYQAGDIAPIRCDQCTASTDRSTVPERPARPHAPCGEILTSRLSTRSPTTSRASADYTLVRGHSADAELLRGHSSECAMRDSRVVRQDSHHYVRTQKVSASSVPRSQYPAYFNRVQGLCGNFNVDGKGRVPSPAEGPVLPSVAEFVSSWQLYDYCEPAKPTPEICKPERQQWAVKKCRVLYEDVFEPCHSVADVVPYYESCTMREVRRVYRLRRHCPQPSCDNLTPEPCPEPDMCLEELPTRTLPSRSGLQERDGPHLHSITDCEEIKPEYCVVVGDKVYSDGQRMPSPDPSSAMVVKRTAWSTLRGSKRMHSQRLDRVVSTFNPVDTFGDEREPIQALAKFCPLRNVEAVECRTVQGKIPSFEARDDVRCDRYTGLTCLKPPCQDFEIRARCVCGE
ncbi:zonadhesin-like [Ornithodoros turicata]|uniref:zonadhesin-like n=1 Tax=Ornithodoros turicata TaxID=34597 RepID=UPI003138EFB5